MPKNALLVACLIGLGCCLLAVLDALTQRIDESPAARPGPTGLAAAPALHRMRGWTSHGNRTAPATLRVDTAGRFLG